MKAYQRLIHAPNLEQQFKYIHRLGMVRGFWIGIILMIAAGVIVRAIV